jgi:hypothetical protein
VLLLVVAAGYTLSRVIVVLVFLGRRLRASR